MSPQQDSPTKFGDYYLMDKVAIGGMAAVSPYAMRSRLEDIADAVSEAGRARHRRRAAGGCRESTDPPGAWWRRRAAAAHRRDRPGPAGHPPT